MILLVIEASALLRQYDLILSLMCSNLLTEQCIDRIIAICLFSRLPLNRWSKLNIVKRTYLRSACNKKFLLSIDSSCYKPEDCLADCLKKQLAPLLYLSSGNIYVIISHHIVRLMAAGDSRVVHAPVAELIERHKHSLFLLEHLIIVQKLIYLRYICRDSTCKYRMEKCLIRKIFRKLRKLTLRKSAIGEWYSRKNRSCIHVHKIVYLHQLFYLSQGHPPVIRQNLNILIKKHYNVAVSLLIESSCLLGLNLVIDNCIIF